MTVVKLIAVLLRSLLGSRAALAAENLALPVWSENASGPVVGWLRGAGEFGVQHGDTTWP